MGKIQPLLIVIVVMSGIYFITSLSYNSNSEIRYKEKINNLEKDIDCLKKEICKCDKV